MTGDYNRAFRELNYRVTDFVKLRTEIIVNDKRRRELLLKCARELKNAVDDFIKEATK